MHFQRLTVLKNLKIRKDTINDNFILDFDCSTNAKKGNNVFFKYYMSKSPIVTMDNYQNVSSNVFYFNDTNHYSIHVSPSYRLFPPGTTVYLLAYGDSYSDPSYIDLKTVKKTGRTQKEH